MRWPSSRTRLRCYATAALAGMLMRPVQRFWASTMTCLKRSRATFPPQSNIIILKFGAAYQAVENSACSKLTSMLPEDLRPDYEPFFFPAQVDAPLWPLVKAADKISALAKCMEEEKAGNREFIRAKSALLASIHAMRLPEAECFLAEFLPGYALTLDELE